MGKFDNVSSRLTNSIANTFYRLGFTVASYPWKTLVGTFFIFGICCLGFLKFEIQRDPLELWVPRDSQFIKTTKWILKNIETGFRLQSVLVTAPNVLEPVVLEKLLRIHHEINEVNGHLKNGTVVKWSDVCLKVPFISEIKPNDQSRRKKRYALEDDDDPFGELFEEIDSLKKTPKKEFEPSVDIPSGIYCKFLSNLPWGCYEKNLLELFKYPENLKNVTIEDVILQLKNDTVVSPVTGHVTDFKELLGGISRDGNGNVVGAKAILIQWFVNLNLHDVEKQNMGNLAGTESWITEESAVWEDAYLLKMKKLKSDSDDDKITIHYNAEKSFGDISHSAMFQETNKLAIGITMMMIYIQIVLSKFSWTEFRFGLSGLGLFSVGLAFLSACGICSALGINYGPVHTSLPFLLMGLGVDDMFVLMACWRKVQNQDNSIEKRIGLMLRHAGASITVTSLTDIIAFLVGSFTVIPSLQSFCLYAAVGVFMTYFYAITFFVAIFTIDEYRISSNRNTFIPCIVHTNEDKLKLCCDFNLMHKSLKFIYGKLILTKIGKVIIIMSVIILTGLSSKSLLQIEQKFDPTWFIPESTYLHKYIMASRTYFPESGYTGSIFMGKLNYTEMLPKLNNLTDEIDDSPMFYKVNSWSKPFTQFVKKHFKKDLNKESVHDFDFRFYLSKFLFSPNGGKYQANFNFEAKLKCGEPTPNISISWIDFRFKKFSHRDDYLPAMKSIEKMVKSKHFNESGDGFAEVWSRVYANWITDEIIDREVYRNIILALVCVMFCTFAIIMNLQVCFWIFICVLLTLVNVGGFMQMWGLTIDLVSCIGLQLAVGLCVDYAAHVGHTFLVSSDGDRNKRVLDTILHIGAAVLYGGGSTLLSLTLLAQSEAYTFKSFFKIFLLVIVFGLFHGVVLLPVILSIFGPRPYNKIATKNEQREIGEEMKQLNQENGLKEQNELDENSKLNGVD